MRGFMFATLSLWSYGQRSGAWEPVIEPWQVRVGGRSRAKGCAWRPLEPLPGHVHPPFRLQRMAEDFTDELSPDAKP